MNQTFTIGPLKLIEDKDGFGVAQLTQDEEYEVIATFKYPLDALKWFTEYSMTLAEMTVEPKEKTDG